MDNLKDLLQSRGNDIPPEIKVIQDYVRNKFSATVGVTVQQKEILITASSAALAGTLQLHRHEIAQVCQTDKKLVIRISS